MFVFFENDCQVNFNDYLCGVDILNVMRLRFSIVSVLFLILGGNVSAQNIDSLKSIVEPLPLMTYDSLKVQMEQGGDTMGVVKIFESGMLNRNLSEQVVRDGKQIITVSRISIFFDNSQNARADANETLLKFNELFPDILADMSHENPYFKVSVGICISTDEALILLNKLRAEFPKAFIVRERISVEELKYLLNPELRPEKEEAELQESEIDQENEQL